MTCASAARARSSAALIGAAGTCKSASDAFAARPDHLSKTRTANVMGNVAQFVKDRRSTTKPAEGQIYRFTPPTSAPLPIKIESFTGERKRDNKSCGVDSVTINIELFDNLKMFQKKRSSFK